MELSRRLSIPADRVRRGIASPIGGIRGSNPIRRVGVGLVENDGSLRLRDAAGQRLLVHARIGAARCGELSIHLVGDVASRRLQGGLLSGRYRAHEHADYKEV